MDTAIIKVVDKIRDLGGFAVDEFLRLQGVDKQVSDLRSKLQFLRAWIQTAEEGNSVERDKLVDVWVNQLRGAVFDAEDIVDEYFQEGYKSRPGIETRKRRRWPFIIPFSEVPTRYDLSRQLGEVLGRLDEIQTDSLTNVQARVDHMASTIWVRDRPTVPSLRRTTPWSAFVVGFDDYKQHIISHLLKDNRQRGAIVVVTGESSGVGKTTAARAVFRDRAVWRHFDVCAWVCMPPNSGADRYLDQIWEQAKKQTHCECPRTDVKQVLCKMKYFLVLDGIDDMDELVDVLSELPDGAKGSRILVTTQLQLDEVNKYIPDIITSVKIECLSLADSVQLFTSGLNLYARRVYSKHYDTSSDNIIYSITGGLPLAVVLLGGLVYFKDHERQWNEVFKLLETYSHLRLIKRLLTVSYVTMPTLLKPCFLYFAAMPPNALIDVNKLERLWRAEGIPEYDVHSTYSRPGVCSPSICALASRGLLLELEGGTKVRIYQSAHMFAKTIAEKTSLMEAHNRFDILGASTVRGLSIHNYADRHMHMDKHFPKLHTLLGDFAEEQEAPHPSPSQPAASSSQGLYQQDDCSRLGFIYHSRFIRILDLQGVKLDKLPANIGHMIHLRYLGLRSCCLKDLPPSVANLLGLETLDITGNEVQSVVDDFWKIEKLKHVHAQILSLPLLEAPMGLPTGILSLHGVVLPSQCTQENFPLKNMDQLFSLEVLGATSANVEVLRMALEEMRHLRQLKIAGDCSPGIMKFKNLLSLELDGMILEGEVGTRTLNSSYPIKIVLRSSCMSQMLFDSFLSRASLGELELLDNSFAGVKLLLQGDAFSHLRKLKLGKLSVLEELVIGGSGMPKLATLEIHGCPNMKKIQGLKDSEYLKMVVLFDMPVIIEHIKAENVILLDKMKHVETAAWASTT